MKPVVAFPFRHHSTMICPEAKQMLIDNGFQLVCNDTGRKLTVEEQKDFIKDAFAIVAGTEKYDSEMLDAAPNLKTIIRFGVGTDNFDLAAMESRGIEVGVISNYNAVAEFTVTLILSILKNLPRYDTVVRNASWARLPMYELRGKTVGIFGYGRIGKRVVEMLQGFHVNILVCGHHIPEEDIITYGFRSVSFDELLRESDIISLHAPIKPDTFHIINQSSISQMKDGAFIINTARGGLVDESALYQALKNNKLSGAAVDVYEKEPVTEGNPLYTLDNIVLSPHAAALTYETNYNAGIDSAKSIINVYNGGKPLYCVKRK